MLRDLATALTLGVAGLDPTGAVILVAALVAGAHRTAVRAFGITVMIGIPLFGSVLSLVVGARLSRFDWWVFVPRGRVGAVLGLVVGLVLLAAAVVRLVRHSDHAVSARKRTRAGAAALVGAGAAYVGSLLIDPTFVAVTVLAGRDPRPVRVVGMQVVWAVLSQLPLLVLLASVERVGQGRAVDRFQAWWARARPVIRRVVTAALLLTGALLVLDATWWFTHGRFLLFDPHRHPRR